MAGPITLNPFVIESDEDDNELEIKNNITDERVLITPDGIPSTSIEVDNAEYDLLGEGEQTGLVADSTGIKYEGKSCQLVGPDMASGDRSVYVEASTSSSDGDEEVTVELYDADSSSVIASQAIVGGSKRTRGGNIASSLTEGNEIYVRFNVTTASNTTDATFDAVAARLIVR